MILRITWIQEKSLILRDFQMHLAAIIKLAAYKFVFDLFSLFQFCHGMMSLTRDGHLSYMHPRFSLLHTVQLHTVIVALVISRVL